MGAQLAPLFLAFEERFRAALLFNGGFSPRKRPQHVADFVDFVRRTNTPVLMINGRYDPLFPFETHQRPFFDLLGTPLKHKRHVLFETGHGPFPLGESVRESLAWLDKYLGPVERATPPGGSN
jgi:pimeloyl-ACP methyl ester carboxylesterase